MSRSYNHRVKPRMFQVGDLVLKDNPCNQQDHEKKEKFEPNWLGPFIIVAAYRSNAYKLSTLEGDLIIESINILHL